MCNICRTSPFFPSLCFPIHTTCTCEMDGSNTRRAIKLWEIKLLFVNNIVSHYSSTVVDILWWTCKSICHVLYYKYYVVCVMCNAVCFVQNDCIDFLLHNNNNNNTSKNTTQLDTTNARHNINCWRDDSSIVAVEISSFLRLTVGQTVHITVCYII